MELVKSEHCMKDPLNKHKYLIPTSSWLRPIKGITTRVVEAIINNSLNVVVKVSKGDDKKIKYVNNLLHSYNNFMRSLCTFSCKEKDINIDLNWENANGFCEGNSERITLSIYKRYLNNFSNMRGKFSLLEIKSILKQSLLSQIEVFLDTGFIHKDIHPGNLFLAKIQNETITYQLSQPPYNKSIVVGCKVGDTYSKVVIGDFNECELFNLPDRQKLGLTSYVVEEDKTLLFTLKRTVDTVLQLLNQHEFMLATNFIKDFLGKPNHESYYYYNQWELKDRRTINRQPEQNWEMYKYHIRGHGLDFIRGVLRRLYEEDYEGNKYKR